MLRVATTQTTSQISGRIGSLVSGTVGRTPIVTSGLDGEPATGYSAGGGEGKIAVWANGAYSSVEDDFVTTAFEGDIYTAIVGADYALSSSFTAGVALGYESAQIDTTFNGGRIDASGFTIAPYAVITLGRFFSIDGTFGYSVLNTDLTRISAGQRFSGDMDSNRWFAAGNLNAHTTLDRFRLGGRLGYIHASEDQDGFTETSTIGTNVVAGRTIDFGQVQISGEAAYLMEFTEIYGFGTYEIDTQRDDVVAGVGQAQPSNDDDGFRIGGGMRLSLTDRTSVSFQGDTVLLRDDQSETTVSGTVRVRF
ncbi:MAG: hypothetical protein CMM50_02725 [Rhodospirillaceae bacterium]|nr:hypothetical protein [Rhodospirillaceae bacterium]